MDEIEKQNTDPNREKHARQTFWQIYLPFFLVLAGIIWTTYWLLQAGQTGVVDTRVWADISTIWILLPFYLVILILFLIVILFSVLVGKSGDGLRKGFSKLNRISAGLEKVSRSACEGIQKILINVEAYTSTITKK